VASFGEHLRRAREERKITLQEICATTKISSRMLQALEDERFDLLPGGIFNKGFVRAYARCVGLNEERTVAEYLAAAKVAGPDTDMQALSSQVSSAREVPNEPWPISAAGLMGILAVLVALVVGGWWLKEHRKEVREQVGAGQKVASQAPSAAPVAIPQANPAVVENAATDGAKPAAAETQPRTQPVNPAIVPPAVQSPAAVAKERTAPVAAGQGAAPVEISISATKRAWISVQSDGKTVETLTLDPDKPELRSRSYKAKEKLMLTVGNAAGLTVTYNGKPAGTLGVAGQRATITFTPQGMAKQ
jgi:cytoskeletal protein RodZ